MKPQKPDNLEARVTKAFDEALKAKGYVAPIDVLVGIGWLPPSVVAEWKTRRIPHLEAALQVNPSRVSQAMALLHKLAETGRLAPFETT